MQGNNNQILKAPNTIGYNTKSNLRMNPKKDFLYLSGPALPD